MLKNNPYLPIHEAACPSLSKANARRPFCPLSKNVESHCRTVQPSARFL
jgi:hypothetical protein